MLITKLPVSSVVLIEKHQGARLVLLIALMTAGYLATLYSRCAPRLKEHQLSCNMVLVCVHFFVTNVWFCCGVSNPLVSSTSPRFALPRYMFPLSRHTRWELL
jgi:hypothetical protein